LTSSCTINGIKHQAKDEEIVINFKPIDFGINIDDTANKEISIGNDVVLKAKTTGIENYH